VWRRGGSLRGEVGTENKTEHNYFNSIGLRRPNPVGTVGMVREVGTGRVQFAESAIPRMGIASISSLTVFIKHMGIGMRWVQNGYGGAAMEAALL
jgi:hypothetical protein